MKSYQQLVTRVGDPLDENTLVGPLHSKSSVENYLKSVEDAKSLGGKVEFGGKVDVFVKKYKKKYTYAKIMLFR